MRLTLRQRDFIKAMTQSREAEADGFTILARRSDAADYFDELVTQGLITPNRNEGPIPADREGFVRLPYWPGLDYLLSASKSAGTTNNLVLGGKIVSAISEFSAGADEDQSQNYNTWHRFAECLANLPLPLLTPEVVAQTRTWIASRFDRSLVAGELGNKVLPRLAQSDDAEQRASAVALLDIITSIRVVAKRSERDLEPDTEVDRYWVHEILKRQLPLLAAAEPAKLTDLFQHRVEQVFTGMRETSSWLYRPAIETHSQNMTWHAAENTAVEGLAETLKVWVGQDPHAAGNKIQQLFESPNEVSRRVAVSTLDAKFSQLREHLSDLLVPQLLAPTLIHETYRLLSGHYPEFSAVERDKLFVLIKGQDVDAVVREDDAEGDLENRRARAIETLQQRWLTAIASYLDTDGRDWLSDLVGRFGPVGDHPDFFSYHETSTGPGPSPYSVAELMGFLDNGTLIQKLNEFVEVARWRAPTKRALTDTLEQAVVDNAAQFEKATTIFLKAGRPYQAAFLAGFVRLWSLDKSKPVAVDWDTNHSLVNQWILHVLSEKGFWEEPVEEDINLSPTRLWLVARAADWVEAGTQDDSHAFSPARLPELRALVEVLLSNLKPQTIEDTNEALQNAINMVRGKAVEALINYALRIARLAASDEHAHRRTWKDVEPRFDYEVSLALSGGNDEFVALFGNYLPQIQYLSNEWARAAASKLFEPSNRNFRLAMSGLGYAAFTRPLYLLVSDLGVIDHGLTLEETASGRERLVERLAVSILRGDEPLDSDRVANLWNDNRLSDLATALHLFWTAHDGITEDAAGHVRHIWRRSVDWVRESVSRVRPILSNLLSLICYFESLDEEDETRLVWLAEQASSDDRTWLLGKELDRLAEKYPKSVATALLAHVKAARPFYDQDDHILHATQKVLAAGMVEEALVVADSLHNLPVFKELYRNIRDGKVPPAGFA